MFQIVADEFWRINDAFHNLMGTGNIALQLIILGMVMMSVHFKRKGDISAHGNTMLLAIITNFFSIALVMITGLIEYYVSDPLSYTYYLSLIHGTLGGLAMLVSFGLTVPWIFRNSSPRLCARKKTLMRLAYTSWTIALVSGLIVWFLDVVLGI